MNAIATSGRSGPGAFFAWWGGELAGLLPERLKRALRRPARVVMLDLAGPEVVLGLLVGSRRRVVAKIDPERAEESEMRRFGARLARTRRRADAVALRLSHDRALRRRIAMPPLASGDLRQALYFEIDRQTPFQRDDVYFDYTITGRREADNQLTIDLWIVPRQVIEQAVRPFFGGEIRPALAEIVDPTEGVVARLDLGEPGDRRQAGRIWRVFNRLLVLSALALMGVALYLPFDARRELDEGLRAQVRVAKERAEATMESRRELDHLREIDRRLRLRKLEDPARVLILDELTRRLPDETWLASLQIDGGQVRVTGYAPVVASLIGTLDASTHFSTPSFQSPVTQDARSGKERFTLAFELESREVAP